MRGGAIFYGRENAPYAPFFCPADSGQAAERQGHCGQQKEADMVAGCVLETYGQKVAGLGAWRERQRDGQDTYPAPVVQGGGAPEPAEGYDLKAAGRGQSSQRQEEKLRDRDAAGTVHSRRRTDADADAEI